MYDKFNNVHTWLHSIPLSLLFTFILVHIQYIDNVGGDAAASARRHGSLVAGVLATACVSWLFKTACFLWLEIQYPKAAPSDAGYASVKAGEDLNAKVSLKVSPEAPNSADKEGKSPNAYERLPVQGEVGETLE